MKDFAILFNPKFQKKSHQVFEILKALQKRYTFYYLHNQEKEFPLLLKKADMPDCILVFGGDGAILHSTKYALFYNAPILGINMGNLGFLSEITLKELTNSLCKIEKNKFRIQKRILLKDSVKRGNKSVFTGLALNDAVVFRGNTAKMISIKFYNNERYVFSSKLDGMLISTPTGSTGYSLSAGGPLLSPTMEAFIIVPLNPHTLTARPMVFPFEDNFAFRVSTPFNDSLLQLDGENVFSIINGDIVRVKKADKKVGFVKLQNRTFYQILRKKLHLGKK